MVIKRIWYSPTRLIMNLDADFSKMGSDTIKTGRKHENIENDDKQFDPSILFSYF
jgi:hypothetical protein